VSRHRWFVTTLSDTGAVTSCPPTASSSARVRKDDYEIATARSGAPAVESPRLC
jgi:hypothetical protein